MNFDHIHRKKKVKLAKAPHHHHHQRHILFTVTYTDTKESNYPTQLGHNRKKENHKIVTTS